jgi:hypothetical protein
MDFVGLFELLQPFTAKKFLQMEYLSVYIDETG